MTELAERFEFVVRWEPYLLRPNTPIEGATKPYFNPNNPRVQQLKQAGLRVGIDFTNKSGRFPNTIKSHALLEYSKDKNGGTKHNEIAEKLFYLYFTEGEFLSEDVLLRVAKDAGFDVDDVREYINNESNLKSVTDKALSWKSKGVKGVPHFFMNGEKMFSGAQDVETFKKSLTTAAERFPATPSSKT